MRLAENKRLTEKNPSQRVKLKFDRARETPIELTSCTIPKNGQDARSTKKLTHCGTGILPVLDCAHPTKNLMCCGTGILPVLENGAKLTIEDTLGLFMPLNLKQREYQKNRSRSKSLSYGLALVFTSGALLLPQPSVTTAQTPSTQLLAQAQQSEINILYVSSSGGSDTAGNGSDRDPFKTLTYALSVAPPNTAILLAPGTYSAQTGEQFPIVLQPNVTVQGNPNTRGQNIVIKGGGYFISPTSAGQNIAILGADGAGLSGVTVTNTNYRGYALWIESSSPIVVNNTFSGSTHDGISVVGTSRPTISKNFFSKNGANGITIFGSSRPEVRENVFENTGFGVNVAQNAAPLLIGNQITRNKDGVVVQAEARPVLRNNYIERNERDGIVAIAQALPDLGTAAAPGGNVIRNNGRHDVNNAAKGQTISAYGNQLSSNRTVGGVDVAGTFSPPPPIGGSALQLIADRPPRTGGPDSSVSLPAYTPGPLTPRTQRLPQTPRVQNQPAPRTTQLQPLLPPRNATAATGATGAIAIPVPNPDARVSEISVQQPILPPNFESSTPVSAEGRLPVPGRNIPLGRGGYVPAPLGGNSLPDSEENAPSFDRARALGFRYRVVVDADSQGAREKMQSLVPDAFRSFSNGRMVMQAGAFREREKAEELSQMLSQNGLNPRIEEIK